MCKIMILRNGMQVLAQPTIKHDMPAFACRLGEVPTQVEVLSVCSTNVHVITCQIRNEEMLWIINKSGKFCIPNVPCVDIMGEHDE